MKNKIVILATCTMVVLAGCNNVDFKKDIEKGVQKQDSNQNQTRESTGIQTASEAIKENLKVIPNRTDLSPALLKEISQPNRGLIDADQKIFENKKGVDPIALLFTNDSDPIGREMSINLNKFEGLIPGGVILLKLNIDKEAELVKQMGVNQAGVWVIFDRKGNEIARNSGSNFDELILELNKAVIK